MRRSLCAAHSVLCCYGCQVLVYFLRAILYAPQAGRESLVGRGFSRDINGPRTAAFSRCLLIPSGSAKSAALRQRRPYLGLSNHPLAQHSPLLAAQIHDG